MTNPFEKFAENKEQAPTEILTKAAERARDLEEAKQDIESQLSMINKQLQSIKEVEIPELMAEIGMESFSLSDGTTIKTKEFVRGSLPKDPIKREKALSWLEANGGEGLIKNDVSMSFDKSEHNRALDIAQTLRDQGFDVAVQSGVNHMTLAAFARERLANGEDLPLDDLGLYAGKRAEFKLGKKK